MSVVRRISDLEASMIDFIRSNNLDMDIIVNRINNLFSSGKVHFGNSNEKAIAIQFVKLLTNLSESLSKGEIPVFSEETRNLILNKILNKENIAIIGDGFSKTILLNELKNDLDKDWETLYINGDRKYKNNCKSLGIGEIRDFVDKISNKPKILILNDMYSIDMVGFLDYGLKNNLQVLITSQMYLQDDNWKLDLIELYYPTKNAQANIIHETIFSEITVTDDGMFHCSINL